MKTRTLISIILMLMTCSVSAQESRASVVLTAAIYEEEVTGNLDKAVDLYLDILKKYPDDRPVAAKTLYHLGVVNEKMGMKKARDYFTRLVNNYPDQTETVTLAKARLKVLGSPSVPITATVMAESPVSRRIWVSGSNQIVDISQDGRYVIYKSSDLWLHDLQSGEKKQITHEGSWSDYKFAIGPAKISPDGKQIIYGWYVKNSGELRLSSIDGSSMQVLHNGQDGSYMTACAWMPDGRHILALSDDQKFNDQSFQLRMISLSDSTILNIGPPDRKEISGVCPSPDGRYIGYCRNGDVFIYDLTTEHESVLVQNTATDALAGWTPDGSGIVFISNRAGAYDLYLLGVKNGRSLENLQLLRKNFGADAGICLTRDGRLFRTENTGTKDAYIVPVDEQTGKLTGMQSRIDPNYSNTGYPEWSYDGKLLYYEVQKGPPLELLLFIHSEETGQTREITLKPKIQYWYSPILSPDGHRFAVVGSDGIQSFGIFEINSESGEVNQLVKIPLVGMVVDPSQKWSSDGKAIFYMFRSPEKFAESIIRRKDLSTGEEKDVYRGINIRWMRISPDGKRFAYCRNDTTNNSYVVGIMDIYSGKDLELWRVPKTETSGGIKGGTWSMDGRYLLVDRSFRQGTELWRFPSAGGPGEKLHFFPVEIWGIVMHPSGKRLAFTQSTNYHELWVLENFLPKGKKEENNQLTMRKLDYAQLSYPYAEISPDGKKIAYYIAGQTKQGVGILDLVSGTSKVLMESGAGGQASKVWSPQSNKIAYRLNGNELHICDIDAANTQLFYKSPEYKLYPTDWSKDGKKILCFFEAQDMTMRIGTIASDGQVRFLASGNQTEFTSEPKFSPDGRYIACSMKDEKGNSDIFILSSDGSQKERVASYPGRDENPVWSPDGKYLLFISDRNRSADLWGIEVNNGKAVGAPFIIKRDLGWHTMIQDLTTNGKLFLFVMGGNEPVNMYIIPVDQVNGSLKGPIAPISVYPTDHSFPRYSPDGKMIAFLSRRGQEGYPKLFVIDEKGAEKELPLQGHFATNVAWHPDNKSLFFAGWDKTLLPGIYEISLETGEIKSVLISDDYDFKINKGIFVNINLLPETGELMFFKFLESNNVEVLTLKPDEQHPEVVLPEIKMPIWGLPSPDGENICYRLGDSLMVVSVVNGEINHIGSSTRNLEATWSPDGKNLMFREAFSLRIFTPEDGSTRTLFQSSEGNNIGGMEMYASSWSPNGNYFLFTVSDASSTETYSLKIILMNLNDNSFSVLAETPKGYILSELRWSPDGSRVIATSNSTGIKDTRPYEYWMLENFLPE